MSEEKPLRDPCPICGEHEVDIVPAWMYPEGAPCEPA